MPTIGHTDCTCISAVLKVQYITTNKNLYGKLPKLSAKSGKVECGFLATVLSRSVDDPVSNLVHWVPKDGRRRPGNLTYVDVL